MPEAPGGCAVMTRDLPIAGFQDVAQQAGDPPRCFVLGNLGRRAEKHAVVVPQRPPSNVHLAW